VAQSPAPAATGSTNTAGNAPAAVAQPTVPQSVNNGPTPSNPAGIKF
jgi:hypothetical protein